MHSKHVFLFPFRWDILYRNQKQPDTSYSQRTDLDTLHALLSEKSSWLATEEFRANTAADYNARTYFHAFVRRALFPAEKEGMLKQYQYSLGEKATYQIHLSKKPEPFDLDIKVITLTVYELGIGILSFSLENNRYDAPEDILCINDYGRRIYPQYLINDFSLQGAQSNFLATQINLFNQTRSLDIRTDFGHPYSTGPDYLPPHILQLLNSAGNERQTFVVNRREKPERSHAAEKADCVRIEPVLDDRMFVLCWYGNRIATEITLYDEAANSYFNLQAQANFWYRFVYVDNGDISSPDPVLRAELLKQTTYTRWATYGTLFGVSRYSFVLLTLPPSDSLLGLDVLSVHLTTIYQHLVMLCLAQRAALLRFSAEVAYISRKLDSDDLTLISEHAQHLNKAYLKFDNRLYFSEVTPQEQGIELYDLLHKMMRVPELARGVADEINKLDTYLQAATGENERLAINRLSIIGGLFGLAGFVISYFGLSFFDFAKAPTPSWQYWCLFIMLCALAVLTLTLLEPALLKKRFPKIIKTSKGRSWMLVITAGLLGIFVLGPMVRSCQSITPKEARQPVIDSTAIQRIDSLRNELRSLRVAQPAAPTVTFPQPSTVVIQ